MTQAQSAKGKVLNLGKLREGFAPGEREERAAQRRALAAIDAEHVERFEGNTEDHFRVGIGIHNKLVSAPSPARSSDLSVASALSLAAGPEPCCSADCARLPAGAHLCALLRRRHYRRVTPRVADDRQGPGRQGSPPRAPPPPAQRLPPGEALEAS